MTLTLFATVHRDHHFRFHKNFRSNIFGVFTSTLQKAIPVYNFLCLNWNRNVYVCRNKLLQHKHRQSLPNREQFSAKCINCSHRRRR